MPDDSGKRKGVRHRTRRYHRRLRHVFYMAAFSSLKTDGPSREFYARKRSERQHHTRAMIALARRLVDGLWALLRDNRTWQPEPPTPLPPLDTIIEIHQGSIPVFKRREFAFRERQSVKAGPLMSTAGA